MPTHRRRLHLAPRQTGAITAPSSVPTDATSLVFNTAATTDTPFIPPPLTGPGSVATTKTVTTPATTTSVDPDTTSLQPSSSVNSTGDTSTSSAVTKAPNIPTGTVVGAILGSFAFLAIIIGLVILHSRKSRSIPLSRDIHKVRNDERRKSRRETWKSLEGSDEAGFGSNEGAMKLKPYGNAYPPMPSPMPPSMLQEKEKLSHANGIGKGSPPQLSLPPLSPLPFSTFNLNNSNLNLNSLSPPVSTSPVSTRHPYANPLHGAGMGLASSPSEMKLLTVPSSAPVHANSRQQQQQQQQDQQYHSFQHPYASASSSSPEPDADDQSFYSMDSPALNTSLSAQQQPALTKLQSQAETPRTGTNPFFTAHPSSHDGPEKWGSVGKTRTIVNSHARQQPQQQQHRHASGSTSQSQTMENLIAALSLPGSQNASISVSDNHRPSNDNDNDYSGHHDSVLDPALNRSQHGHLSVFSPSPSPPSLAPSDNDHGYENPFEFDEVYGQDIAFTPAKGPGEAKARGYRDGRESEGNLSTATTGTMSFDGPSPGMFPMPPR